MNTDTLFGVFQYLSLKDLYSCMLVCDEFYNVANHDIIWKRIISLFISQSSIQKLYSNNYKNTLSKYFYLLDRFDWMYLINLEDKPHRFFKQDKPLHYKFYKNREIDGHQIIKHLPTSIEGYDYIPELGDHYLKSFRKARSDYMCLLTIHVYAKDESIMLLIDSDVDEAFIFINEHDQYNVVGCMNQDNADYNCYISSNDTAYFNDNDEAPIIFYGKYQFSQKNPVLSDELLKYIHWYFDNGLTNTFA